MTPHNKSSPVPEWILSKMKHYCAFQERCLFDVKTRLQDFRLQDDLYEKIILKLEEEDYLNEERFARAFAGGKLRINHWGKNKIYAALQQKKVPELFIQEGLNSIDDNEYRSVLREVIAKKNKEIKETDINKRNKKLANFAISKGFEPNLVWNVLNYKE